MKEPLISVVMVTCNVERFLAESIESILAQTFSNFEFIIVDFGSTDKSKAIAQSYAEKDPRIRVHEIRTCGLAEARNAGCFLAQGRYIAIMDADDISLPDRLRWEFDFMESHPEVGFVGGATEWIDATGRSLRIESFPTADHELRMTLAAGCSVCQPTVLIRREAFVLAGGYRPAFVLGEDYDLWLRLVERWQCANLRQVVLKYRSHPFQVQLRKVKHQSLCILAAQASASARRNGNPDPLNSVEEITPAALAALGVSETTQRVFASCDLIRGLYLAGEYSRALAASIEALGSSDWKHAQSWQIADTRLTVARLYWRQGKYARSLLAAGHALVSRPIILGRPLKPLLRRFQFRTDAKGSGA
jgi:glycosyltransferase involved in cell wall biosynthesis